MLNWYRATLRNAKRGDGVRLFVLVRVTFFVMADCS
jgi:hypothetical protein